eukprot:Blabericola_migrator_1__3302@NODE_1973_length_3483_cov_102_557377_g1256_i0_p5_GENE_NODE_1973_length_3483_cov_102_557377_g1256_i0NODE_1973_length_3483_cov_102_557377_g1256_i0_p5_ORF_typecomplete_len106_score11_45_NODE_1973_length_3483_cov_102_557377_g1256_i020782395
MPLSPLDSQIKSCLMKELCMFNKPHFEIRQEYVDCLRVLGLLDHNDQLVLPENKIESIKDGIFVLLIVHWLDAEPYDSPHQFPLVAKVAARYKAHRISGTKCMSG